MNFISKISIIVWQYSKVIIKKYLTLLLISSFIFLCNSTSMSQTKEIDSLKVAAKNSSDIEKSKILLLIADKFSGINFDSVVVYRNRALDIAKLSNDNKMIIRSLDKLASINFVIGNNARSIQLYNQAKILCIKAKEYYLLANIYMDLKMYYSSFSNYAGVLSTLDSALKIIDKNNIPNLKSVAYRHIANLYVSIQDFEVANHYTKMSLSIAKDENDKISYTNSLLVKGNVFLNQYNYDSTLYYYNMALSIAKEKNDKELLQIAYRRITEYYIVLKDYYLSERYIDSSIIYCKQLQLNNVIASLITDKAHISSQRNDIKNTLNYNLQALAIRISTGGKSAICSSLI